MISDGIGDGSRFASLQRIIPPHHALQFRELANHFRHEVGLSETRGAFGKARIGANFGGEFVGERGDALHLVTKATKLGLEGDGRELLGHVFQGRRLVLLPEEPAIIEPRRQDAGIALGELLAAISGLDVRYHDEVRRQLPGLPVINGEIFLVCPHG